MSHSIEIEGLGKRYVLGGSRAGYATIREAITSAVARERRGRQRDELWALLDLSLTVDEGETVGVIGHNGSGKTTLLKILARITAPTTGVARTRGRVGALLEVGAGFHPELTGRENVFLNGAVLGLSRRDTARHFDEIVEFAEVQRFLDTPLKRYSSGMYLRLAFSVAAHLEPNIVVMDEVLAVGDVEFRMKCMQKVASLGTQGRTVIFVSHDLGAVARACPRTLWIERGGLRLDGPTKKVIDEYLMPDAGAAMQAELPIDASLPVQPLALAIVDGSGVLVETPRRDEPLTLRLTFHLREPVPGLDLALYLTNRQGVRVIDSAWSDTRGELSLAAPAEYETTITIPPLLTAGEYAAGIWMGTAAEQFLDREVLRFTLWPRQDDCQEWIDRRRAIQPDLDWRVAQRET